MSPATTVRHVTSATDSEFRSGPDNAPGVLEAGPAPLRSTAGRHELRARRPPRLDHDPDEEGAGRRVPLGRQRLWQPEPLRDEGAIDRRVDPGAVPSAEGPSLRLPCRSCVARRKPAHSALRRSHMAVYRDDGNPANTGGKQRCDTLSPADPDRGPLARPSPRHSSPSRHWPCSRRSLLQRLFVTPARSQHRKTGQRLQRGEIGLQMF